MKWTFSLLYGHIWRARQYVYFKKTQTQGTDAFAFGPTLNTMGFPTHKLAE